MSSWQRDPLTGLIAVCEVQELYWDGDVSQIPFSDRARAEQYASTIELTDDEVVAVSIVDY